LFFECVDVPTLAEFHVAVARACVFCLGRHESDKCTKAKLMSLEERKNKVKKSKVCYRCLKGHMVKSCRSHVVCYLCSKRHTTVMCPNLKEEMKTSTASNAEKKTEIERSKEITLEATNQVACTNQVVL
jgi:hypothetical protein